MQKNFLTFLLLLSNAVYAQKDSVQRYERPENAIYAGFLGDATLFSLNYESLTVLNDALILSARLGFGFNEEFDLCLFGGCDEPDKYFVIPHHITINLGHRQSFFEAGLGGAYIPKLYAHPYYLFPMFGYRFIPVKETGPVLRFTIQVPVTGFELGPILFLPVGVSLGGSF
ncbi:MAG: hypothetical protein R2794_08955 [Chitinophagales bacterium]